MKFISTQMIPRARNRRPASRLICFLAAAVALAACSRDQGPPPPCPRPAPVADAQELVRFNGQGHDLTDVLFEAKIDNFALICEYDDDVIEAGVRLRILAVRGPADSTRQANFRYFLAIATRDRKIVAREEFDVEIPFPGNRTRVMAEEELTPRIPLKPGESGANYLIYIGLVLKPAELEYNRANR